LIVPRLLNKTWLLSVSENESSERLIEELFEEQTNLLNHNIFNNSKEVIEFHLDGVRFSSERCGAICTLEIFEEIFKENNHFKAVQQLFSGNGWIVDVGANHGFFTLYVKKHFPNAKILAIEPNPYVFELLKKNIFSNGFTNVTCMNVAAGHTSEFIQLPVSRYVHALSGLLLNEKPRPWLDDRYLENITVQQVEIDSIIKELSISLPEWIKIDVEGMEEQVIDGSTKAIKSSEIVGIERHRTADREKIINRLENMNFLLHHEDDPNLSNYFDDLIFIRDPQDRKYK